MVRKRVTTRQGNRVVAYTTKREAVRAKDRAPRSQRIYKIKSVKTRGGVEELDRPLWAVRTV